MNFGQAVYILTDVFWYKDLEHDLPRIQARLQEEGEDKNKPLLKRAFDAYMAGSKGDKSKRGRPKDPYTWVATDVKTGKVVTRNKVKELSKALSIPYTTIINAKQDGRLLKGRYKITTEETGMPPEPRKSTKGLGPYIWKAVDIETKKVIETGSLAALANELSIGEGRIYNAELTGKLVEGRYKIIKKSNPKAIGKWQAINTKTGETIKTRTAVEMSRLIGFSRASIYDHAKNGVPLGDYIIKHKK